MTTRRDILTGGAGLAAILASGKAPAALVRSMVTMRNALMAGKRLPYDAEVEYLESTGTQYIDTGWKPTSNNLSMEAVFVACTGSNFNKSYFGSEQPSTATVRYLFVLYDYNYLRCYTGNTSINTFMAAPTQGQMFAIKWDVTASGFTVTDKMSGTTATKTFSSTLDFTAFANTLKIFQNMDKQRAPMKLYSFKIWDNGVLVRDYIPVRKDGVGYMYDRVSGQLFGNAGTGAFVVGPDK